MCAASPAMNLPPAVVLLALVTSPAAPANPLLSPSPLPYAYPPFDRITDDHHAPAFDQAMRAHLAEIEAILGAAEPPTFANTLVALERSGADLARVRAFFFNLAGAHGNDRTRELERTLAPRLAAHADRIRLDPRLFARVDRLHAERDRLGLDAESRRLLERTHADLVRAGARLAPADQDRLRALNAEISSLQTHFTQNVLQEVNAGLVFVERAEELAGLEPGEIAAAAAAARG